MDALTYVALGAGLAVLIWVAIFRRPWLKYALTGFGLLAGAAAARAMLDRQRRLRELGVSVETAGNIALLTVKAEEFTKKAEAVGQLAEKDKELRRVQKELEAELKTARKEGADVEEIRAEIRKAWPGF